MNTMKALIKREYLEGWNYYVRLPAILLALTIFFVVLTVMGVGNVHFGDMDIRNIESFGEALSLAQAKESEELPAAITLGYWAMSALAWGALPFVVFFSLLGTLYEERRDRSILFFKSLPVTDWQEVLAKLVTIVIIVPIGFFAIIMTAHILTAMLLSAVALVQGGPVSVLWPLGTMISGWVAFGAYYILAILWALPLLAWVLAVSAYASRSPFLFAVLPPIVVMVAEEIFFDSNYFLEWVGLHMGSWQGLVFEVVHGNVDIDGPTDILRHVTIGQMLQGFVKSFVQVEFLFGLLVAAGFIYAAVRLRQRSL